MSKQAKTPPSATDTSLSFARLGTTPDTQTQSVNASADSSGRRRFLIKSASTGLVGAITGLASPSFAQSGPSERKQGPKKKCKGHAANQGIHAPMTSDSRSTLDFQRRTRICRGYANAAQLAPHQLTNGDEERYRDARYYASFSKTLPCNQFGEVEPSAFEALQRAMEGKRKADFDAIPLSANSRLKLANPQGAFKYQSCGPDGQQTRMPPSHPFASAQLAGEMVEVYWQAVTRDIPYSQYQNDQTIAQAISDLNDLSRTPAQRRHILTTTDSLFRGETSGDLKGPYISQFLWQDYQFGPKRVDQRYPVPTPRRNFMTSVSTWLNTQRGNPTERQTFTGQNRYIYNNRTLAAFVHADAPFQAYLQAGLILLGYGQDALDPNNPYLSSANQGAFVSHGTPYILDLVTRAAQAALHAAWYQKWSVHRYLRPEATAGRVHFHVIGQRAYDIHSDLLNSAALDETYSRQGNYLLGQAYPEGSPTHPSYPAGHACIAGACVTVLKALFNEDFSIPNPVVANHDGNLLLNYQDRALKVGDELNKLACNMSLGRDAAGVHYRQDGIQGLKLGEEVAKALLQEQSSSFFEPDFEGYLFRDFDGDSVEIRDGVIE